MTVHHRRLGSDCRHSSEKRTSAIAYRGSFENAIPYRRSIHLTALVLRILSFSAGASIIICLGVWQRTMNNRGLASASWCYGAPTAVIAMIWSSLDIVVPAIRHTRGSKLIDTSQRTNSAHTHPEHLLGFRWASPGYHVAVHLLLWLATAFMAIILWARFFFHLTYVKTGSVNGNGDSSSMSPAAGDDLCRLWAVPSLQTLLGIIHFVCFVLACAATNERNRTHRVGSDVVFIPGEQKILGTKAVPSSLLEVFRPKTLPLALPASQLVQFRSARNGTVEISAAL